MEQYIPKKALVAEIEKIIADEEESIKCFERRKNVCELRRFNIRRDLLYYILSIIDTIETKEVDLEKEIDKELETRWRGEYLYTNKFRESAKHFFELGLKAQKGK